MAGIHFLVLDFISPQNQDGWRKRLFHTLLKVGWERRLSLSYLRKWSCHSCCISSGTSEGKIFNQLMTIQSHHFSYSNAVQNHLDILRRTTLSSPADATCCSQHNESVTCWPSSEWPAVVSRESHWKSDQNQQLADSPFKQLKPHAWLMMNPGSSETRRSSGCTLWPLWPLPVQFTNCLVI